MTFYSDNHVTIYNKDCRAMSELRENSIQCVVTSPPYWGLRKYSGVPDLIWGDNHCEHEWVEAETKEMNYVQGNSEFARPHRGHKNFTSTTNTCSFCNAWKGSYGLEPTPEMYIEHTIEILREIRRVLRKDGVVFWNIGDSYWGGGQGGNNWGSTINALDTSSYGHNQKGKHPILKPKDLCLIPFRVAIAAQEDGWWVRSIIIWSKPNPMPESVTDRPTESHEYILMLTKSKKYYWDADAVREASTTFHYGDKVGGNKYDQSPFYCSPETGRNIRSVWEFPTQPYPEAHFAVFPEKLPEICIKAATPEVGCCSKCGAPWERITKVSRSNESYWGKQGKTPEDVKSTGKYGDASASDGDRKRVGSDIRLGPTVSVETLGWQPTCKCNAEKVPSIVLDPFAGAGTTLWVAKKLNRKAVGYELSEEYCKLALDRNTQQVMSI